MRRSSLVALPVASTQLLDHTPVVSIDSPHQDYDVTALAQLTDGSIITCSSDYSAKRWLIIYENNVKILQQAGTYTGHSHSVRGVIEKDKTTIITGSRDRTLKEWETTSCECINTLKIGSGVYCMLKTKTKLRFVCGLGNGMIEIRRVSDLVLLSSFNIHSDTVYCVCELKDGSFVSGANDYMLSRWNDCGKILQVFPGHTDGVYKVIKLKNNIVVSAAGDRTLKLWKLSSGECLHTSDLHTNDICGLIKISDDKFISGSSDQTIRIWDDKGDCIETIRTEPPPNYFYENLGGWINSNC